MQMSRDTLATRIEPWDFIKPPAQNKVVHMNFSLCLRFYLKRSFLGSTVHATAGFLVELMEVFAPQCHCRTPWKCPQ
jgi:hypothetical protein